MTAPTRTPSSPSHGMFGEHHVLRTQVGSHTSLGDMYGLWDKRAPGFWAVTKPDLLGSRTSGEWHCAL